MGRPYLPPPVTLFLALWVVLDRGACLSASAWLRPRRAPTTENGCGGRPRHLGATLACMGTPSIPTPAPPEAADSRLNVPEPSEPSETHQDVQPPEDLAHTPRAPRKRRGRLRLSPDRRTAPPPVDFKQFPEIGRRMSRFLLLVLATLLTSSLPLPWQAGSLAFAIVTIVDGIRTARTVWRPGLRERLAPLLVFGLALTVLTALSIGATFAVWSIQMAHQECTSRALTITSQEQCDADYQDALNARLTELKNQLDG